MVRTVGEDKSEQKVIDDIAEHGWHCVNVLAEGEHVGHAFTVGLFQSYGHPELIIFGLPSKIAHQILTIAADAAKACTPLDLTKPSDDLLKNYSCCFAEVPLSEYYEHVGYARWYYQGNGFPLYQIVWPSKTGLFPRHPQATPEFRAAQPVIAQTPGGT
jgi:hypothetical protein